MAAPTARPWGPFVVSVAVVPEDAGGRDRALLVGTVTDDRPVHRPRDALPIRASAAWLASSRRWFQ